MIFCRGLLLLFLLFPSVYSSAEEINTPPQTIPMPPSNNPPLNIAIQSYVPPFVMQGAHNEIYGFDIDMMNSLCRIMKKTCQFKIMKFDEIINAVAQQQVDAAVSSITITADRAKLINFTLPYLLSYSRFLTNRSAGVQSFSLLNLKGKKIGVESGSIFPDQIKQMGIIDPVIKTYSKEDDLLEALRTSEVDFLLFDNPTALYWEANSSQAFMVVGEAYQYGFGLGIAVAPSEKELLQAFNAALLQYQNSKEYKTNFDTYLHPF
ncbi:MAG: transporter substrate-binding domain-containing protein [bacterium]|nr:transporter substrate-binding domain-containing protein [bacterium]